MNYYSATYPEARSRFLTAAQRLGCSIHRYAGAAAGPDGEPLSCDVAILGDQGRSNLAVVISSGLHGVEGFFGSAVQLALMERRGNATAADGPRLIFVHALNPFGFAWLRRCDAENIDPNRNFVIDPSDYQQAHPTYARLDSLLNPARSPGTDWFPLTALFTIARSGYRALRRAVAEGQYQFPRGLFYGGSRPCWTREILDRHLPEWLADCSAVVHIDLHTGLGRHGEYRLMFDYPPRPEQFRWLAEQYQRRQLQVLAEAGAYQPRGSIGQWLQHRFAGRQYVYICAEFGTYSGLAVISALRRENQAHHFAAPDDPETVRAKQRLMEVFCPSSASWRQRALEEAVGITQRAIAGIPSLPQEHQERLR